MIELHRFADTPLEWQELSNNGGDEDWIVTVSSDHIDDEYMLDQADWQAERFDSAGTPQRVTLPDGRPAWIASHA